MALSEFLATRRILFVLAVVALFILLAGSALKLLIAIPILIAVGAFSMFYHHFISSPVNFELVKFVTVLSSVAYGIPAGLFVGFASNVLGHILSGKLDDTLITSIVGNAIIALVAGILPGNDMFTIGMLAVLANYAFIVPFIFVMGRNLGHAAVWVGTNVVFNLFLFSQIAPFVIRIM